ncbi:gluconolactonase [Kwoniella heveanensis BCC8398]|uniref:Gluconolactonase n=1 Tax=Kwoniella heveanensis BCC8398 TaxID=1296120 RepID=A0A1B9GS66_9TREE|nr:gluconolactonase [Kwoniella heveanensis BCC8398]
MVMIPFALAAITFAINAQSTNVDFQSLLKRNNGTSNGGNNGAPRYAQVIRPSSFAVLDTVPPPTQANGSTLFFPPGTDADSLAAKPFLIYDDAFYDIIGSDPTLTLIASTDGDPLFHEANTWYPPTDEMFFVQNAGAPDAGTGLAKSAVVEKISLAQAQQIASQGNGTGQVDVITVNSTVQVVNPNGGTNFQGKLVFAGEGQGDDVPSALYLVDPVEPYETKVILNNYYGRQFNSLNDVAVNPRNKELYFTDVTYGYLQDFRPAPGLQNQVYRFNYDTGAVGVVADGFNMPNGLTFSPDGKYAYVADTGTAAGFWGSNYTKPASLYRFDVTDDGLFENRVTFAFVHSGVPDGVHCDSKGNVYAGCGDGVHVWNPSGLLIGKIWVGSTSANFQFAGQGRMVISAETKLYYATLGAEGADITSANYSG